MKQSTNSLDDTSDYLCGICPRRFSRNTLLKHITEHIEIPVQKHAHFLWCNLCSPLLRPLNVRANNDHSDYPDDCGPISEARDILLNGYDSNNVHNPFISTKTQHCNNPMDTANTDFFPLNGSSPVSIWYDYNEIESFKKRQQDINYPTVNNDFSTLNGPLCCRDPTNNSSSNSSISIVSFFRKDFSTSRVEDVTNLPSLSEELAFKHLPETASAEIPCEVNVAYAEPLPETANFEIPCSGQSAYAAPLLETASAEIPCSGQSTYAAPLPETASAEIPCSGQSAYIEPLPETARSEIYCSGQAPFVEYRPQTSDSESRLSESPVDKFCADVCHSSCSQKGPDDKSSADTLNPSGPRVGRNGSGRPVSRGNIKCRIASNANSHGRGSDNTRENVRISSLSLTDSKGNLSYSAIVKRGLLNRQ